MPYLFSAEELHTKTSILAEVLEGSSGEVEDETLVEFFRGQGRDEARNFASFLGHFEVERTSARLVG